MTKNITLTSAEIQTLLTACMAAIAHYCMNDAEAEPYKAMIERLEEIEAEVNTYSKGEWHMIINNNYTTGHVEFISYTGKYPSLCCGSCAWKEWLHVCFTMSYLWTTA